MKKKVSFICIVMFIMLLLSGCIDGNIVDDDTDEPLADVDVTLTLEDIGIFHTQTNAQGKYEFNLSGEDQTNWPSDVNGTVTVAGGIWQGKVYQSATKSGIGSPDPNSVWGVNLRLTPVPTPAEVPVIEEMTQGIEYIAGNKAEPLTVSASVNDGGILSYQWYQSISGSVDDGTEIAGETSRSYTPDTSIDGIFYYYCVVSNYNEGVPGVQNVSATSNVVKVVIHALVDAQAPEITQNPQSKEYIAGSKADPLTVSASVSDGGAISYQWYQGTSGSVDDGREISGETSQSYIPDVGMASNFYYYCVVTNYNIAATGSAYASSTSTAAKIAVKKPSQSLDAAPFITTATLPNGTVGVYYSQALAATGTAPITWLIDSGSLPNGLKLNSSTGEITGVSAVKGTAVFTVRAANGFGQDAIQAFSFTIKSAISSDEQGLSGNTQDDMKYAEDNSKLAENSATDTPVPRTIADVPITGDDNMPGLYLILFEAGMAGMIGIAVWAKRKKKNRSQ
jgi:hypothetical protein